MAPSTHKAHQPVKTEHCRSERPGHTLQPTALVNEAYRRLMGSGPHDWRNRAHFIGVSAAIMRHIPIDYARRRQAFKRHCARPASPDGRHVAFTNRIVASNAGMIDRR